MPHKSLREIRAGLQRQLRTDRYVDALLVVAEPDGSEIFRVGGRWDCLSCRYVAADDIKPHVVKLKLSQVPAGRALKLLLEAMRRGDPLAAIVLMLAGARGSGKTWFLGLLFVVFGLAFPREYQFGVNITTSQRLEVVESIQEIALASWLVNTSEDLRDPWLEFVTGNRVKWFSSKNPKRLRQAKLKIRHVAINEGQDQPEAIYLNALGATRNVDGLVSIATNRPQEGAGDWVSTAADSIEAGDTNGLFFLLDPRLNNAVQKHALDKRARAIAAVSPSAAAADSDPDGPMRLSGDIAYPAFSSLPWDRGGHVGDPPRIGWHDVTREIAGYDYVAGCDFQKTPGCNASVGKLYRDETGKLVLWICQFIGTDGVEEALSQALITSGYFPGPVDFDGKPAPSLKLIGDATGARQNAEHRRQEPYSFVRLGAEGWKVEAPMLHWRTKVPWYPLVRDSRAQMHSVLSARQIMISPRCLERQPGFPSLIDSFKKAKATPDGKLEKKGHMQHGPDGVRYLAWRYLPRPVRPAPGGLDAATFDAIRKIRVTHGGG